MSINVSNHSKQLYLYFDSLFSRPIGWMVIICDHRIGCYCNYMCISRSGYRTGQEIEVNVCIVAVHIHV